MEQLKCSRCDNLKPISEFSPRPNRKRGYHSFCKPCFKEYKNQWQAEEYKDPEKRKRRLFRNQIAIKRNRKRKMTWVIEYLKQHPCIDCGETDPVVLDFDHIDTKEYNLSVLLHNGAALNRIQAEIKKCVVRCSNCHRKKTARDFNHLRFHLSRKEPK